MLRPQIVLDSGAWSAFTSGVPLKMDEYVAWCHMHRAGVWWYSNLDDMGSWQRTKANQKIMEDAGLTPVPVFHTGEPWHVLESYCEQYSRVAVGKIVPYSTRARIIVPWLRHVFEIAAKHGTKVHGFGVTNVSLLKLVPFNSVDSSKWTTGHRFGRVNLWDRLGGCMRTAAARTPSDFNRHRALFMDHQFEQLDFYNHDHTKKFGREKMGPISVIAYLKLQQYIKERTNPPLALCLAGSGMSDLKLAAIGMAIYFGASKKCA
jgi:hypothetical protein